MIARLLRLLALILCVSFFPLAQGQAQKGEKKALTREQVAAAYSAVKDFGCTHAGYESDSRQTAFSPRYSTMSGPGLPKDPLDYLKFIYHSAYISPFNRNDKRIYGTDRTWSSYALRLPSKTGDGDVQRLSTPLQHLPFLRCVDAGGTRIGDASAKALAAMPDLQALFLDGTAMGDAGLVELSGAGLVWLDLSRTRVTDKGMEELGRRRNLRTLSLANTKVTDKGLHEISGLGELRSLDLSGTSVELTGNLNLSEWKNLTDLSLARCAIKDDALKLLARLPKLEELDLSGTEVTGTGLAVLASLPNLRVLRLTDAPITDEGGKGIGALKQIRTLYVNNSPPPESKSAKNTGRVQIGDDGLAAIGGCTSLRELNLARTSIKGRGFEGFAKHAYLRDLDLEGSTVNASAFVEIRQIPNLRSLNLARTGITGDGLHLLADLQYLTRLNLEESKANDSGLAFVFRLTRLRELNLQGTAITSAGVKALGDNTLVALNLAKTKVDGECSKTLSGIRALRSLYVYNTGLVGNGPNQFKTTLPECTVVTQTPKPQPPRNPDEAPRLPVES